MPAPQDRPWTKGPWEASVFMVKAGHDKICQTGYSSSLGPHRSHEAEANARLIAAAPELYEAAKTAFDFLDNWEPGALGWTDATEELRAALSKALGERP